MRGLLFIFIFAEVNLAYGQSDFGVKAGWNISDVVVTNYINRDFESELALKSGLHAGFFLSGMVNEQFGMAAEILYSDKGVRAISNVHLRYINVPLIIQYKLADRFFAEAGPELGYLFSARSKHGNVSNTYNNKFDVALDGGFRYDTPDWIFSIRYSAGLFSVREPIETVGASGHEQIKYQNRVLQLSLGYKLWSGELDVAKRKGK